MCLDPILFSGEDGSPLQKYIIKRHVSRQIGYPKIAKQLRAIYFDPKEMVDLGSQSEGEMPTSNRLQLVLYLDHRMVHCHHSTHRMELGGFNTKRD